MRQREEGGSRLSFLIQQIDPLHARFSNHPLYMVMKKRREKAGIFRRHRRSIQLPWLIIPLIIIAPSFIPFMDAWLAYVLTTVCLAPGVLLSVVGRMTRQNNQGVPLWFEDVLYRRYHPFSQELWLSGLTPADTVALLHLERMEQSRLGYFFVQFVIWLAVIAGLFVFNGKISFMFILAGTAWTMACVLAIPYLFSQVIIADMRKTVKTIASSHKSPLRIDGSFMFLPFAVVLACIFAYLIHEIVSDVEDLANTIDVAVMLISGVFAYIFAMEKPKIPGRLWNTFRFSVEETTFWHHREMRKKLLDDE